MVSGQEAGLAEGVRINPEYVREVPAGGLVVLRCEMSAPTQLGPFSRRLTIETDDPKNPVAELTLAGTIGE